MRRLAFLTVCALCTSRVALARQTATAPAVTVFYVPGDGRDTLVARAAEVRVIVRDVRSPNRQLKAYDVDLEGPKMLLRGRPDTTGLARFAALPSGEYKLRVRSLGYAPVEVPVSIGPGCPTWVEAYLTTNPCIMGACPPPASPRATITTCNPLPAGRPPAGR